MDREAAQQAVHEALRAYLDDGEIAIAWTLTIDVAGPDGIRYLAHRAGGGHDGTEGPVVWAAVGMLEASLNVAREQIAEMTSDLRDEDDDEEDDD